MDKGSVKIFLTYEGGFLDVRIFYRFFTYHGSTTITSSSRIISRDIFTIGFELVKALLLYII
jgi:hypothetical protein